jgi:pimeloyl-ACP methyl ester carboxylesterase
MADVMSGFTEQALLFGRSRSLVGILARPTSELPNPRPTVVILNTGIIHRIGHHRMYVTMARQLAAGGHCVLRFDFSGIGDSRSRDGVANPTAACLADIVEALNFLEDLGYGGAFILIGLCSGADIALRYGPSDKRVTGLVLLDPTIPPTVRFYAHYIGQRLTRLRSWLTFALGRGRIWRDVILRAKLAITAKPDDGRTSVIDPKTRGELERIYKSLVMRGTKLLVVLTGGPMQGRQSYREQLLEAFPNVPFHDTLVLEHFEDSDHTFTSADHRERLKRLVLEWAGTIPFGTQATPGEENLNNRKFGSGLDPARET